MSHTVLILISAWLALNFLLVPAIGHLIARRRRAGESRVPPSRYAPIADAYVSILLTRLVVQACRILDADRTALLVGDGENDRRFVVAAAHGMGEEAIGRRVEIDRALAALFGDRPAERMQGGAMLPVFDGRTGVTVRAEAPSGRAVILCASTANRPNSGGSERDRLLGEIANLCAAAVDDVGTTGRPRPAASSCAEGLAAVAAVAGSPPPHTPVNLVALAAGVGERLRLDPGALIELQLAACVQELAGGRPAETAAQVARIPGLEVVALVVGSLDERWDGLGRPHGLRGERIPLASRILSACSAVHALAKQAPDGSATPVESALRRVQAVSGAAFDPTVVTAVSHEILGDAAPIDDQAWATDWARADVPYALA